MKRFLIIIFLFNVSLKTENETLYLLTSLTMRVIILFFYPNLIEVNILQKGQVLSIIKSCWLTGFQTLLCPWTPFSSLHSSVYGPIYVSLQLSLSNGFYQLNIHFPYTSDHLSQISDICEVFTFLRLERTSEEGSLKVPSQHLMCLHREIFRDNTKSGPSLLLIGTISPFFGMCLGKGLRKYLAFRIRHSSTRRL